MILLLFMGHNSNYKVPVLFTLVELVTKILKFYYHLIDYSKFRSIHFHMFFFIVKKMIFLDLSKYHPVLNTPGMAKF